MAQFAVEYPERVVVGLSEKASIRVLHADDEAGFSKAVKPCLEMQGVLEILNEHFSLWECLK